MKFTDGIKTPFAQFVTQREGFSSDNEEVASYIPWMTAVALSRHEDVPSPLNGALVIPVGKGHRAGAVTGITSRCGHEIYMPIVDGLGDALPINGISQVDINRAIVRGRAKMIAIAAGIGLPLWVKGQSDVRQFLLELGAAPGCDLSTLEPLLQHTSDGIAYVPWAAAVAAASITSDTFRIQQDPIVLHGMVRVTIQWRHETYADYYPIAESKNGEMVPLDNYGPLEWNRASMRGLTRLIAQVTGYGASTYADESIERLHSAAPLQRKVAVLTVVQNSAPAPAPEPMVTVAAEAAAPVEAAALAATPAVEASADTSAAVSEARKPRKPRQRTEAASTPAPAASTDEPKVAPPPTGFEPASVPVAAEAPTAPAPVIAEAPLAADATLPATVEAVQTVSTETSDAVRRSESIAASKASRVPGTSEAARAKSDSIEVEMRRVRVREAAERVKTQSDAEILAIVRARLSALGRTEADAVHWLVNVGLAEERTLENGSTGFDAFNRDEIVAALVLVSPSRKTTAPSVPSETRAA